MKATGEQCPGRKIFHALQPLWRALLLLASFTFCIQPGSHADHYVAQNGQTPADTYTSWETAASGSCWKPAGPTKRAPNHGSPSRTSIRTYGTGSWAGGG